VAAAGSGSSTAASAALRSARLSGWSTLPGRGAAAPVGAVAPAAVAPAADDPAFPACTRVGASSSPTGPRSPSGSRTVPGSVPGDPVAAESVRSGSRCRPRPGFRIPCPRSARRTPARRSPLMCPGPGPAVARHAGRGQEFRLSQQRPLPLGFHAGFRVHRRAFSVDEPTVRDSGWARNHPGRFTTIQAAIPE
jgi:hypothetical protein